MVLAHQGGWDEILFILGPILVVVVLLRLAKRRVDAMATPTAPVDAAPTSDDDPDAVSGADDARSRRPPS